MKLKERLISLSGHDHRIVQHCDAPTQKGFFLMGLSIPVIFAVCCASSFVTFWQSFDNRLIATILSLFFAWMIMNLYRLLLQTFGRNPLPEEDKKIGKLVSRVVRLCFVCFIATMIAKPLEATLYKDLLDLDIAAYKARARKDSHYKTVLYYQQQINEIIQLMNGTQEGDRMIQEKAQSRRQAILQSNARIEASGFFLQRLRLLCVKHRSCWWITAFFLLVFLYPLALKYHLRNCSYYRLRGVYERRKVDLSYYVFRKRYAHLFKKHYRRRVVFEEPPYEDPPYNTIRRKTPDYHTENEFITELYHV